jgi:hypothetical protein
LVYSGTAGLEVDSANLTFNGTILTSTGFAGPLNGTVGATTPAAGAFTTLSTTGAVTITGGTANGVAYLDGSKVLTTGTALTFNGSTFAVTGTLSSAQNSAGLAAQFVNADTANGYGVNIQAGGTAATRYALVVREPAGTQDWFKISSVTGEVGNSIFAPGAPGSSEIARFTTTGLGIGTSSPGQKLDVVGSASAVLIKDTQAYSFGTSGPKVFLQGLDSSSTNTTFAYLQGSPQNGNADRGFLNVYTRVNGVNTQTLQVGTGLTSDVIVSAGNLGLGVTPSAASSAYRTFQLYDTTSMGLFGSGYGSNLTTNAYLNSTTWTRGGNAFAPAKYEQFNGAHTWSTAAAAGTTITWTDAMTLDASGNFMVGATSTTSTIINGTTEGGFAVQGKQTNGGASVVGFYNAEASSGDSSPVLGLSKAMTTTSSSARFVQFFAGGVSTTPMGGIVGNGASNVQFATLSDVREKTNIQLINGSLAKISALKPVEFDWIKSGEHVKAGFVAQDVEEIFPEFVVDNMSSEGEEVRKGLTGGMTGGIIPHLVKAIQEQQALIQSLTTRLAALEAK